MGPFGQWGMKHHPAHLNHRFVSLDAQVYSPVMFSRDTALSPPGVGGRVFQKVWEPGSTTAASDIKSSPCVHGHFSWRWRCFVRCFVLSGKFKPKFRSVLHMLTQQPVTVRCLDAQGDMLHSRFNAFRLNRQCTAGYSLDLCVQGKNQTSAAWVRYQPCTNKIKSHHKSLHRPTTSEWHARSEDAERWYKGEVTAI